MSNLLLYYYCIKTNYCAKVKNGTVVRNEQIESLRSVSARLLEESMVDRRRSVLLLLPPPQPFVAVVAGNFLVAALYLTFLATVEDVDDERSRCRMVLVLEDDDEDRFLKRESAADQ